VFKNSPNLDVKVGFEDMFEAVARRNLRPLTTEHQILLLWSLAKVPSTTSPKLLSQITLILEATKPSSLSSSPQVLGDCLWALATLRVSPSPRLLSVLSEASDLIELNQTNEVDWALRELGLTLVDKK
jgi:hypothetical protein